jgi:hypothetical protein
MWICGLYLSADGSLMTDHLQLLGHPMVCFVGAQLCLTCWLVTHEVHGRPPLCKRQPPRGSLLKLVLCIVLCYAIWSGQAWVHWIPAEIFECIAAGCFAWWRLTTLLDAWQLCRGASSSVVDSPLLLNMPIPQCTHVSSAPMGCACAQD